MLLVRRNIEYKQNDRHCCGVFFILTTASSIIGTFGFIDPILKDPNYLSNIYSCKTAFTLGILIDSINSAAVVAIAFMLYPVFRKQNKALAMGYISSRIIDSVVLLSEASFSF